MIELIKGISIGETIDFTILIASLFGAVTVIVGSMKKIIDKQFTDRCSGMMCEIKNLKEDIEHTKGMVMQSIEETEKSDLGVVRSRLQHINKRIKMGDEIDMHEISSCHHDLDRYDYLREKYQYITYGDKKVKINGEIEEARKIF